MIIIGDFNAKARKRKELEVGAKDLLRNKRGDMLVQFCREHKMIIMDTLFEQALILNKNRHTIYIETRLIISR